jgi:bifunctional non-homologous end joining protein LigD
MDQRDKTLLERKRTLAKLLKGTERMKPVSHVDVGEAAYEFAVKMDLEGVVAKKLGSYYRAGRSANWLKIKTPIGRERERRRLGLITSRVG